MVKMKGLSILSTAETNLLSTLYYDLELVCTRVLQPSPHIYYPTTFPFLFLDQSTGNEGIYLTKMAKVFGEIFLSFLGLHPSFLQVSSRSTIV